jgi:hypothetical protein
MVEVSITDKLREFAYVLGGVINSREVFFVQRETDSKENAIIFIRES